MESPLHPAPEHPTPGDRSDARETPDDRMGRCVACSRHGGDAGRCGYCGEIIRQPRLAATALATALIAAVITIGAARHAPIPPSGFVPWRMDSRTPVLAAAPVRGAQQPAPSVFHADYQQFSAMAIPLALLALLLARLHRYRPELHLWSLVVIVPGFSLAGGIAGTPADRVLALGALLGAHLRNVRGDVNPASRPGSRFDPWMVTALILCLYAPAIALGLRIPMAALTPHRHWVAGLILAALVFRPAHCAGPVSHRVRLLADFRKFGARLLLVAVTGLLGCAGGRLAWTPCGVWQPHALTLTLAGLFILTSSRCATPRPTAAVSAPDNGARQFFQPVWAFALAANLWIPSAAPQVATAVLNVGRPKPSMATARTLEALVLLAGLAIAVSGGWAIPLGGGAWLAEASRIPPEKTFWLSVTLGFTLGWIAAASLSRRQRAKRLSAMNRVSTTPALDANATAPRRTVARFLHILPVTVLAYATLGVPGVAFLAAAILAGQLPALLNIDPVPAAAFILVPVVLECAGVALPY